jgi:gamma-glutamyltranspeptidase / glutathione hydrolase
MPSNATHSVLRCALIALISSLTPITAAHAQSLDTTRPVLLGKHWVAVTGKPQGATAGAMIFQQGGNAVDAAAAMLAATATMWDVLGWGGETQALIYNPHTREVLGINALGVAPTGATPEFFREQGMLYPPEFGPLAAVTPGTPGGLMVMVAEYGRLSLAEVLAPAIQLAEGYPIEASQSANIERRRDILEQWPDSAACSCRTTIPRIRRRAPRRRPAKSSASPSSRPRWRSWSKPRPRRWRWARVARKQSTPPTSASIAATSRPRSCAPRASKAGCSPPRTSPTGK